ncbi:unnamed protein product [Victoria cruziana]
MEREAESGTGFFVRQDESVSLAWSWILETLADTKQVDISLLKALVTRIPGFGGKLFDNARERISLRCLEELLDSRSSGLDGDPSVRPTTELERIGSSERCEDAFLRLSKAVHGMDNKEKQLELLRLDIQQRRTGLGKPPLEKIAEGVSDGGKENLACNGGVPTNTGGPSPSRRRKTCATLNDVQSLTDSAAASIPDVRRDPSSETEELGPSERCETFVVHDVQLSKENRDAPILCEELDVPQVREQFNQQEMCHRNNVKTMKAHLFELDPNTMMHGEDQLAVGAPAPQIQKSAEDASTNDIHANDVSHGNDVIPETSRRSGGFSNAAPVPSQCVGQNEGLDSGRSTLPSFAGPIDHASFTVGSEQGFCIKCNEGGNLLSCDGIGCPISVHSSCLGSSVNFDNNGKFYCPYCTYRVAVAAYRVAKEKVSLARKELLSFMRTDMTDRQQEKGPMHKMQLHSAQEAVTNHVGSENGAIKKQRTDCLLPKVGDSRSFCEGAENDNDDHVNGNKEARRPEQTAEFLDDVDKAEENTVESHKEASETPSSKLRVSRRRPAKRYANSMFPCVRRKKLPWTKEEEDALKEGVEKFSGVAGSGYPWTKILEYGRHVYHKTRTPIDLKDKWRNIQRRELPQQR